MDKNLFLEIAKQVGQPIDPSLPVPFELAEIADVDTVEAGEKLWRYTEFDPNAGDSIYAVDGSGTINAVFPNLKFQTTQITDSEEKSIMTKSKYYQVNPKSQKLVWYVLGVGICLVLLVCIGSIGI